MGEYVVKTVPRELSHGVCSRWRRKSSRIDEYGVEAPRELAHGDVSVSVTRCEEDVDRSPLSAGGGGRMEEEVGWRR